MKKLISISTALLLLLLILFCLYSCKKPSNDDTPDTEPVTSEEPTAAEQINEVLSTIKRSSDSTGGKDMVAALSELSKLDFSVTDLKNSSGTAVPDSYLYFKDNTVYFSFGGNTSVIKLSELGFNAVSTANGKTSAQISRLESELDTDALAQEELWETLEISEDDLKSTDKDGEYTLSKTYVSRVAKKLLGDEYTDSVSEAADTTFTVDISEYKEGGKLSLYVKNSETEDMTTVTAVIDKSASTLSALSVESKAGEQTVSIKTNILDYDAESASMSMSFAISGAEMNISADAQISATANTDGSLRSAEISLNADINGQSDINAKISYDTDAIRTAGKKGFAAELSVKAKDAAEQKYSAFLLTEAYSEEASKYKLSFTTEADGNEESLTATVQFPAVGSAPTLLPTEQLYLDRGKYILENYDACLDKAQELTAQLEKLIKNKKWGRESLNYYTVDKATGVVYLTEISVVSNTYAVSTRFVPDHENYTFAYCENVDSFKTVNPSAISVALSELSYYTNLCPEDYLMMNTDSFWVYTYVEEGDVYVLMNGNDVYSAVYINERPTEEMLGGKVHELVPGDDGSFYIHDYVLRYNEHCQAIYECSDCGFYLMSNEPVHYFSERYENIENEKVTWEFAFCEICGHGEINLYNTDNCPVTVKLDKVNKDMIDTIRANEELSDYTVDFDKDMVITEIYYHFDSLAHRINTIMIDIPQISDYCNYKIVGVTGGFVDLFTEKASLSLPEGVEFIMDSAFYRDPYESIYLPDSLLYVGRAFSECFNLKELTIPKNVKVLSGLYSMRSLEKLVINAEYLSVLPEIALTNLTTLEINSRIDTFYLINGTKITELIIPEGVREVLSSGTQNASLRKIVLPSTVEKIGENLFANCTVLEEVVLGSNITEIGPYAFYHCHELVTIKVKDGDTILGEDGKILLPDSVEKIGERAFSCCYKIKEVYIPEKVTEIPLGLFENCFELSKVELKGNISKIDRFAFSNDSALCEIVIPSSVEYIGESAFRGCKLLTDDALKFGEKLTYIGDNAFYGCSGLKNIVLGKNLTYVGKYSFSECPLNTLRIEYAYDHANQLGAFLNEVTYTGTIKGLIHFGNITNIHTTALDEESPHIKHSIPAYVQEVNFAGSEEVFLAAGYKWNEDLKINFNVKFD